MNELRRIALLMSKNIGYNRDVIEGIYAYSQKRKNWIFHDAAPSADSVAWIGEWNPDGIIGHIYDAQIAELIQNLDIPLVNTTDSLVHLNYPLADVNHFKVGQMAAEYLLNMGMKNFAYLGSGKIQYSKQRYSGFCDGVGGRVEACYVEYLPRIPDLKILKKVLDKIDKWVRTLPKPVGIFCSNDVPARDLADQCLEAGIKVPEEVAILGVDNDLVECRLSRPPLSSIEIPAARIGYGAAEMLDKLIHKNLKPEERAFTPPPVGVVERGSSNMNAVGDKDVRQALAFIQKNFASIESIDDVVSQVALGRRSLEMRFRKVLGMSILDCVHQKRIIHSKHLLVSNEGSIADVAETCGYHSPRRFSQLFKQREGVSPLAYRRQQAVKK